MPSWGTAPSNGRVNRVERLIINLDTAMPMVCSWDECDKRARTPYQVRCHEHLPQFGCSYVDAGLAGGGRHALYAFCCEGHLLYWVNASGKHAHESAAWHRGQIYGMKPEGLRNRM